MRTGGVPFRDVFSSQGPLFLPLVWVADLVGFRTLDAPRLLALAAGVLLVAAPTSPAAPVTDRPRGPPRRRPHRLRERPVGHRADRLRRPRAGPGDDDPGPLLRWRRALAVRQAAGRGLGMGATSRSRPSWRRSPLPVALVLLAGRRPRPSSPPPRPGSASTSARLPWGPPTCGTQSYRYHLDAAGDRTPGANAKVLSTLGDRDLPVVAAAVALGAVLAAAVGPARHRDAGLALDRPAAAGLAGRHRARAAHRAPPVAAPRLVLVPPGAPRRPATAPVGGPGRRGWSSCRTTSCTWTPPPDPVPRPGRWSRCCGTSPTARRPSATSRAWCGGPGGGRHRTWSTPPSCASRPATSRQRVPRRGGRRARGVRRRRAQPLRWGPSTGCPSGSPTPATEVAARGRDLGRLRLDADCTAGRAARILGRGGGRAGRGGGARAWRRSPRRRRHAPTPGSARSTRSAHRCGRVGSPPARPPAPGTAPSRLAPVSPSISRSRRSAGSRPAAAPTTGARARPTGDVPAARAIGT